SSDVCSSDLRGGQPDGANGNDDDDLKNEVRSDRYRRDFGGTHGSIISCSRRGKHPYAQRKNRIVRPESVTIQPVSTTIATPSIVPAVRAWRSASPSAPEGSQEVHAGPG